MPKTLRVLPRGTTMVPHLESLGHAAKRFVGHKFVASELEHIDGTWEHHGAVEEVPSVPETDRAFVSLLQEYVAHVRQGALWPADKSSADACGVKFDPSFGMEHGSSLLPASFVSLKGEK